MVVGESRKELRCAGAGKNGGEKAKMFFGGSGRKCFYQESFIWSPWEGSVCEKGTQTSQAESLNCKQKGSLAVHQ